MKIKAANGFARILKAEGIPWVSCYPTNHVNNALGEEGVPILMMGEERFAVAVADGVSRVTNGKQIGVCTVMANLNAAGIQMAYGAIAQAWEDSSPLLVIAEGVGVGASRHTHYDMAEAFRSVTKWVGKVDRADLVPDYARRAFTHLRSGRPGPVLLIIPRDLGEYDEAEHPYSTVKGWRSGPDPDDVRSAVKALLAAKDPLLYVGEGVLYADATAELRQFAEAAQVPPNVAQEMIETQKRPPQLSDDQMLRYVRTLRPLTGNQARPVMNFDTSSPELPVTLRQAQTPAAPEVTTKRDVQTRPPEATPPFVPDAPEVPIEDPGEIPPEKKRSGIQIIRSSSSEVIYEE